MKLNYIVNRSPKRHKLTITVERDRSVVVHAPENTPEEQIQEVVDSRRQWIYEKIGHSQKYRELPHPPGKELISGESVLYLGRSYRIEVIDGDLKQGVHFDRCFTIPAVKVNIRKRLFQEWYLEQARDKILPRVKRYAREMGVEYASAKIVDSQYRWGSCTAKNNINLNWRLIKAPVFVIDYIIVHELAHLMEPNHTPRFWNIVRTQAPLAVKGRAWLKENGHFLESEI